MCFRTGSSSESLPSSASSTTAAAVNCFETDPASKIVVGVIGTSYSRFAIPYARVRITRPSRATPTAQPGVDELVQPANTASTAAALSAAGRACAARVRGSAVTNANAREEVTIMDQSRLRQRAPDWPLRRVQTVGRSRIRTGTSDAAAKAVDVFPQSNNHSQFAQLQT